MLKAYKGDPKIKAEAVARAKTHREMGRLKTLTYGEFEIVKPGTAEFRGCAIGCLAQPLDRATLTNDYRPGDYTTEIDLAKRYAIAERGVGLEDTYAPLKKAFNFSYSLCELIDRIFERSAPRSAKDWPLQIVEAIPVGRDVSDRAIHKIVEEDLRALGDIYEMHTPRRAANARRALIKALQS